jgi:hypothetical protein
MFNPSDKIATTYGSVPYRAAVFPYDSGVLEEPEGHDWTRPNSTRPSAAATSASTFMRKLEISG